MAHIRNTLAPHFTGHIGGVRFVAGHAECNDPDAVAFFADRGDEFDVTDPDDDGSYLPDLDDLED